MSPARLGVVVDYPEEQWPSMDLVGEMVLSHVQSDHADRFTAGRVCPTYRHRVTRLPVIGASGAARNVDRLLNRFLDYPRAARRLARAGAFDVYHLIDHSYSQLVHALPSDRTVVTCHDLDTFRCLLDPAREPRPRWFRAMTGRILSGLRKAAAVVCDSEATRDGLIAHGIQAADRLHVVYLGTHPACTPDPNPTADAEAARLIGHPAPAGPDAPELLHVGSNIPRKRVDVLLKVFAGVREARPLARLVKVGGAFPPELDALARSLGVSDAVVTLPYLDRDVLAAVYRRASLVLQPSEAEGFGLPMVEALACGTPLLASDLPVLREVGGDAPVYRPVADVPAWTDAALTLLDEPVSSPDAARARRGAGTARARLYSWSAHTNQLVHVYGEVLSRLSHTP